MYQKTKNMKTQATPKRNNLLAVYIASITLFMITYTAFAMIQYV